MSKRVFYNCIVLLILSLLFALSLNGETVNFCGRVGKIKRTAPYPFAFRDWQCKIKIHYVEIEETGEYDYYVYKAYPRISKPKDHWMCYIPRNTYVCTDTTPRPNSPLRGEVVNMQVVDNE